LQLVTMATTSSADTAQSQSEEQAAKLPQMSFRYLGQSGVKVSALCMGTMTFGAGQRPGNTDESGSHALLDQFVQAGGNFIDTAGVYNSGQSERIIGSWLAARSCRQSVVLATKFYGPVDDSSQDQNCRGASRRHMIAALDDSLERLATDRVDLLQQHCFDAATPLEETLRTAHDLIRSGRVHYFGVSNFSGWQLQKAVCTSERLGLEPVLCLQQQYSLLSRQVELELLPVCANEGVGLLAWSPLKGGLLTGKFSRPNETSAGAVTATAPDASTRVGWGATVGFANEANPSWAKFSADPAYWRVMEAVNSVASKRGVPPSQVALRWLLHQPAVASVIIGAKTPTQLAENLACESWRLTADELKSLTMASDVERVYPYEMQARNAAAADRLRVRNANCVW
ncbi:hypothetical protein BOX15_Mlig027059g2, partial [Macrostomum lignano]